jgi:HAD superfamily hydrolase (TIGR01509 family)
MTASPPSWLAAVVLDLDGVLIDSEPVHRSAWLTILAERGLMVPEGLGVETLGWRTRDVADWLGEQTGVDGAELLEERNSVVADMAHRYAVFPDIAEAVDLLRGWRLPVALASSGTHPHIARSIEMIGLVDVVAEVVSGEDCVHGKPHPEIYQRALERLGVPAAASVAFEDSGNGVASATAAGFRVVAVRARPPVEAEADARADDLFAALRSLGTLLPAPHDRGD